MTEKKPAEKVQENKKHVQKRKVVCTGPGLAKYLQIKSYN